MTVQDFAYWLQGFAELNSEPPTAEQWQSIREHLALVFTKVTPDLGAQPLVKPWPFDHHFSYPPVLSPSSPGYTTVTC